MSLNNQELSEVRNMLRVKGIVRRSENPHPITVMLSIGIVICLMYIIYIKVFKLSIHGTWVDDNDVEHKITHNIYSDLINIDDEKTGIIRKNLVLVHKNNKLQMGIALKNQIRWMNGDVWHATHEDRWGFF